MYGSVSANHNACPNGYSGSLDIDGASDRDGCASESDPRANRYSHPTADGDANAFAAVTAIHPVDRGWYRLA